MYAAPIRDMRSALAKGTLGDLAPFPFAMMSGNCLGWLIYGYFQRDPFLIAANLPGFVLSLWLNSGTSKLQYLQMKQNQTSTIAERNQILQRWDADRAPEESDDTLRRRRRQHQMLEEEEGLIDDNQLVATLQMTPMLIYKYYIFISGTLLEKMSLSPTP